MKVSVCICEGLSASDHDKYIEMVEIIESCERVDISPPEKAIDYVKRYKSGTEETSVKLRPQIDNGVTTMDYGDKKSILINLNKIDESIDIIRITHDEFEE